MKFALTRRAVLRVGGAFGVLGVAPWLLPDVARAGTGITLFVLTRSLNANAVHYDVALDAHGQVDRAQPLRVYWRMFAEDGRVETLTWLEESAAYGYDTARKSGAGVAVRLRAFPKRSIQIVQRGERWTALTSIAGTRAVLQKIHVVLQAGLLAPEVLHVVISGRAEGTRAPLSETLVP